MDQKVLRIIWKIRTVISCGTKKNNNRKYGPKKFYELYERYYNQTWYKKDINAYTLGNNITTIKRRCIHTKSFNKYQGLRGSQGDSNNHSTDTRNQEGLRWSKGDTIIVIIILLVCTHFYIQEGLHGLLRWSYRSCDKYFFSNTNSIYYWITWITR